MSKPSDRSPDGQLHADVVKQYDKIISMLGKNRPDVEWVPFLSAIAGWDHWPKCPLPLLDVKVNMTIEETVLGHLVIYQGFVDYIKASRCVDLPVSALNHIHSCYLKLMSRGGFQIYWSGTISFSLLMFGLNNRIIEESEIPVGTTWQQTPLNKVYGYDSIGIDTWGQWVVEMASVYGLAERISMEVKRIPPPVYPHCHTLFYNCNGTMGLLPVGDTVLMRMFEPKDIAVIRLLGGDLAALMPELIVESTKLMVGLDRLNPLEVKMLMSGGWDMIMSSAIATHGLKLLNSAIAFKLLEDDRVVHDAFMGLEESITLARAEKHRNVIINDKPAPTKH